MPQGPPQRRSPNSPKRLIKLKISASIKQSALPACRQAGGIFERVVRGIPRSDSIGIEEGVQITRQNERKNVARLYRSQSFVTFAVKSK